MTMPLNSLELDKKAEEYRRARRDRLTAEDNFEKLDMFDENVEESYKDGFRDCLACMKFLIEEMSYV